uniref:Secreted protein n=1 Tax=Oryza rufipogon TaxID=4529 RepID=A0A0E0P4V5_ORYRU
MLVHTCTACCYRLLVAVQSVLICRLLPIASATSRRMLDADASQLPCGHVVVGRLGTPTASIGEAAASPARAAPPAFNVHYYRKRFCIRAESIFTCGWPRSSHAVT